MKLKQKLGVAAVFALGVFVIISSSESTPSDVRPTQSYSRFASHSSILLPPQRDDVDMHRLDGGNLHRHNCVMSASPAFDVHWW